MGTMTEGEMRSEIRMHESLIGKTQQDIAETERTMDDFERMRIRMNDLLQELASRKERQVGFLSQAISLISVFRFNSGPTRFAQRYQQNMQDVLGGSYFAKAVGNVETGAGMISGKIRQMLDLVSEYERYIHIHEQAIQWLQTGITALRAEAEQKREWEEQRNAEEEAAAAASAAGEPVPPVTVGAFMPHASFIYTWENYICNFPSIQVMSLQDIVPRS